MKKVLTIIAIILGAILLFVLCFSAFILITEFKPDDDTALEFPSSEKLLDTRSISILSWNIGYAGLDASTDFFMDGGTSVNPTDKELIKTNLEGINRILSENTSDFYFLQEVDYNSTRSFHIRETEEVLSSLSTRTFGRNFVCNWIPYPFLSMLGKIDSGVMLLTDYKVSDAHRISLPSPFKWPVSVFNLKRCLLVNRIPVSGSDKELVLVNLHLEAYDDGEGKLAQTKVLMSLLEEEYAKGNYVIAGGDFNQSFPGANEQYGFNTDLWTPGLLEENSLSAGWSFAYDISTPTCRSLDKALTSPSNHQYYAIDGFILSPNVKLESVKTLDYGFKYSDHNPVAIKILLE